MGRNFAEALSTVEGLDIEGAITMHLQSNHYLLLCLLLTVV